MIFILNWKSSSSWRWNTNDEPLSCICSANTGSLFFSTVTTGLSITDESSSSIFSLLQSSYLLPDLNNERWCALWHRGADTRAYGKWTGMQLVFLWVYLVYLHEKLTDEPWIDGFTHNFNLVWALISSVLRVPRPILPAHFTSTW